MRLLLIVLAAAVAAAGPAPSSHPLYLRETRPDSRQAILELDETLKVRRRADLGTGEERARSKERFNADVIFGQN